MSVIKETKMALQFAKKAHEGQLRAVGPDTGLPYFDTHVLRVVKAVSDTAKPAAALHDVVEDTDVTLEELRRTNQFCEITLQAVDLLTRRADETYWDYIDRLTSSKNGNAALIAREVKLADLIDNFTTLPHGSLRKRYLRVIHLLTENH